MQSVSGPQPLQSSATQSQLVQRVAADRDGEAFRQLFEFFSKPLRLYFIRRGSDFASAEELSQETMLMVWRKASLYRADVGPVSAWVYVIARNLRIDKLRRSVPWLEVGPQAAAAVASRDVPADEQVLQQQHCQLVTSAVAKLTSKQRTVVTLGFSEGMSHREISDKLSLPLGTVKSRTRLGHAKLRSALDALR